MTSTHRSGAALHPEHVAPQTTLFDSLTEGQRLIVRQFVGGTLGGFLQALTSHPLDTVKAQIQSGKQPSVMRCVSHIWRDEGFRGFFKGVQMPFLFGGVFNSVLFSLNQVMQNLVSPADRAPHEPLALWRTALAAQMATPFYVMVLNPIERVKVVLQLEGSKKKNATGFFYALSTIYHHNALRGFMRGYCPNVGVHLIGLPAYFVGYQVSRSALSEVFSADSTVGQVALPVVSGTSAGALFCLVCYPFDLIKTKMQATHHKSTMTEIFREVYSSGGMRSFYKGLSISLLRSAPANASVWIGIEYTQRWMRDHGY